MKLQHKIVLLSFGIAILMGSFFAVATSSFTIKNILVSLGATGFFIGLIQIVVGLFLLFKDDKRYAQGFLISGGLLMLIGFATCTANFTLNMH